MPAPVPYVREQQAARLRTAQRNLETLGQVNPLALEEFEAMSERHAFLARQLDDLKQTRKDLLDIIDEVDNRVQEVFASAFVDIQVTFSDVFARLFPEVRADWCHRPGRHARHRCRRGGAPSGKKK